MDVVVPPQHVVLSPWRRVILSGRAMECVLCGALYLAVLVAGLRALRERATFGPLDLAIGRHGWHVAWVWPGSVGWDLGVRVGDTVRVAHHAGAGSGALLQGATLLVTSPGGHLLRLDPAAEAVAAQAFTSLLGLGIVFFLLSLLVHAQAADRAAARAFAVLCVSAAMALTLVQPVWLGHAWALSLEFVAVAAFGSAWATFFLTFPRRYPLMAPVRVALLVVPIGIVAAAYAAAVVVDVAWYGVAAATRGAVVVSGIGFGCIRLVWTLRRSQTQAERRLLLILTLGSVLGIAPFLICTLIPSALDRAPLIAPGVSILPIVLMAASFAYAVARHRLFGTTVRLRRAVARLSFGVVLAGATLILAYAVTAWMPLPLGRATLATAGVMLGLLVAAMAPFVWRRLDRSLFADVYDVRHTLHDLTTSLARLHDPQQMGAVLCQRLSQEVATRFATLLTYTPGAVEILATAGPPGSVRSEALTNAAATVAAANPTGPVLATSGPAALWVPLRTCGALYGLLALGPKRNGEPFSRTDQHLLHTIAGTAAAALHGAELAEQQRHFSRQLIDAHEEERRALARDLHDGPLARLVHVSHLLASAGTDAIGETATQQCDAAIAELRSLCNDLRTSVLDTLGLADALEALVEEARPATVARLSFSTDETAASTRLAPAVETALYRGAQEALTNGLRHAQASSIRVQLTVNRETPDACVRVVVADDGRGFAVPATVLSPASHGHFGLVSMTERMQGAGGHLRLQSAVDRGTQVVAEVPLSPAGGIHDDA